MANWIGTITNAGNNLLNAWVAGKNLNFDGAMTGTGTVVEVALMAQTSLTDPKQKVGIVGAERVNTGYRLKIQVQAADEEYTLNQIGVWVSLTDGVSTMLALFQNSKGVPIPSKAETPDFLYTFYALVMCSNTGSWTVSLDPTVFISRGELSSALTGVVYSHIFGEITERDPSKPTYGIGGGGTDEDVLALVTGPYTGQAEVAVVFEGKLYDAQNVSTDGATAPEGNIILQEE